MSGPEFTHLSLFSGIGGLDLAAEVAGFKTVGQCERARFQTAILERHWPCVPKWNDIHQLTKGSFYERTGLRTVDIISGGFPCQPFSKAGQRRGKEDDRYLWPEMLRIIKDLRPTWVLGENVANFINMALDDVLSDLEAAGYSARTFMVPARGVGALHQRYRVAVVANADGDGFKRPFETLSEGYKWNSLYAPVAESELPFWDGWATEPTLGRVVDGVPDWVDRIRSLGNAVMPQQFYPFFRYIKLIEEAKRQWKMNGEEWK